MYNCKSSEVGGWFQLQADWSPNCITYDVVAFLLQVEKSPSYPFNTDRFLDANTLLEPRQKHDHLGWRWWKLHTLIGTSVLPTLYPSWRAVECFHFCWWAVHSIPYNILIPMREQQSCSVVMVKWPDAWAHIHQSTRRLLRYELKWTSFFYFSKGPS